MEVDILLRIHLRALIVPNETDDFEPENYLSQIQKYQEKYAFPRYYKRNSLRQYVRLADIADDLAPYIQYCLDLDQVGAFYCCQMEQAVGILNDDEITIFMSTDSGICYDLLAIYDAIFETIFTGETDYLQANTFYGKVVAEDSIRIAYHSDTGNIDPDDSENVIYSFPKRDLESGLMATIEPTSKAFADLNRSLTEQLVSKEALAILNEVFPKDLSKKVHGLLEKYRTSK